MRTNVSNIATYEGGKAMEHLTPLQELKRTVLSCLLFENTYYESGVEIAERIKTLVPKVNLEELKNLIITARNEYNLRHIPLYLVVQALEIKNSRMSDVIYQIIQRPDEITELIALYWQDGKKPLPKQLKKGIAKAFDKFDSYQFAKYNKKRDKIKLRDVLFLCHPKPKVGKEQLYYQIANDKLPTPDTWEVNISREGNRKEVWERLIGENKLGALAFLRNLRNMVISGVNEEIIREKLKELNVSKLFPFTILAAYRAAPEFESELEYLLFKNIGQYKNNDYYRTAILVDVSGSMENRLSKESTLERIDSACTIAVIAKEIFENVRIFSFSDQLVEINKGRGFDLIEKIKNSQPHYGTYLGGAIRKLLTIERELKRLIVVTDEQIHDVIPPIPCRGYLINIAPYKFGVGYGRNWVHIDGFSEAVIKYIIEYEKEFPLQEKSK